MSSRRRQPRVSDLYAALIEVLTPDGVQASSWELFQGAIFGRDSEQVALDLLPWNKSVAERVIFSLVRLQGKANNEITEEEPGRIHHEYRHLYVGGKKIGKRQQELLTELSCWWGGNDKEMIYYGSVDATPQLVRLIAAFCLHYGNELLEAEFVHRNGRVMTIKDSLLEAVAWICKRLEASDLGFLEFKRSNPKGIMWQVMRDGQLSYLHEDGTLANANAPIASLEVQALAYDALLYASELLIDELPDKAKHWHDLAQTLQKNVFEKFWIDKNCFFAMAIDRDKNNTPRLLTTYTSVPAELLVTRIFDSLSEEEKKNYIGSIVEAMYGPDFLSDVGIRSRALRHASLLPHWDYQGSNVSWVVTTNVFALGLRRQGFYELAEDMENRMLNGATIAEEYLEYFFVDENGHVLYQHIDDSERAGQERIVIGTNQPENTQAWTVSALLGALLRKEDPAELFPLHTPAVWQKTIENSIFENNPKTLQLNYTEASEYAIPNRSRYYVDKSKGKNQEESLLRKLGYIE